MSSEAAVEGIIPIYQSVQECRDFPKEVRWGIFRCGGLAKASKGSFRYVVVKGVVLGGLGYHGLDWLNLRIGNNVNKEVVVLDPCLFEAANESNLLR